MSVSRAGLRRIVLQPSPTLRAQRWQDQLPAVALDVAASQRVAAALPLELWRRSAVLTGRPML